MVHGRNAMGTKAEPKYRWLYTFGGPTGSREYREAHPPNGLGHSSGQGPPRR